MLQERRNEKIVILTVFIMNWRCRWRPGYLCGVQKVYLRSLGRNGWAAVAGAAHSLCVCLSQEGASTFYWTHSCSTASRDSQGALLSVDPFAVFLWAAFPDAGGHLQQGSPEMFLSAWPSPSPGLGTEKVVGTETQLRTRSVGCLGGGGFLQLHQLSQVKILHRIYCHASLR